MHLASISRVLSMATVVAVSLGACGPSEGQTGGAGSSGESTSGEPTVMTTGGTTTDSPETSTGAESETTATDPDSSSGDAFPEDCSVWQQDCPEGFKCQPVFDDNEGEFDTGCYPVFEGAAGRGEPCSFRDGVFAAPDGCDADTVCFEVDLETGVGTCLEYCRGSESEPTCSGDCDSCNIQADGTVSFCLEHCDPLASDCPDEHFCAGLSSGFVCVPGSAPEPDPKREAGAPCGPTMGCADGLACLGVCLAPCDLGGPDNCDEQQPGTSCMPFDGGAAPDQCGAEGLAFCG